MKTNNIPSNATLAPAKKAENKKLFNRQRRYRRLAKLGFSEDQIQEIFKHEANRMVLCLYYSSFKIEGVPRVKKHYKRDKKHHIVEVKEETVNVTLTGRQAAEKFLEDNKIKNIMKVGPTYCYIKTDADHVDELIETLKPLGRTSVTKPELMCKEKLEKDKEAERKAEHKANNKPSNNTEEVKKAAKKARKDKNKEAAEKRTYYAALRKGGVSARIKKYNKTLAEKIEKWLKERKKTAEEKAERLDKHKRDRRQMSSLEQKANKRARKAAKRLATIERLQARQKAQMENNAKLRVERAQKAQKPVQTKLELAA